MLDIGQLSLVLVHCAQYQSIRSKLVHCPLCTTSVPLCSILHLFICLFICLSVHHQNHTYWPLCSSTIMLIDHYAHQSLCSLTTIHMLLLLFSWFDHSAHRSHWPSCSLTIMLIINLHTYWPSSLSNQLVRSPHVVTHSYSGSRVLRWAELKMMRLLLI